MKHERNTYRRNERDTACPQLLIIPTTLPRVSKIGKTQSICSIIFMTTMHTPSSPFCFPPWLSGGRSPWKDEHSSCQPMAHDLQHFSRHTPKSKASPDGDMHPSQYLFIPIAYGIHWPNSYFKWPDILLIYQIPIMKTITCLYVF